MKEYLGPKSTIGNTLDIVAVVFFGLMTMSSVIVLSEEISGHKGLTDIMASIILMGLFAWGAAAAVIRIMRRSKANEIAQFFYNSSETLIKASTVGKKLKIEDPGRTVQMLLRKKFLEEITYDPSTERFITYKKKDLPEEMERTITCPTCGGDMKIRVGTLSTCEYCGYEVVPTVEMYLGNDNKSSNNKRRKRS